ncbi:hypothetical protein KKA13_00430 [Patescibacteria group bacterium]|nr:hypothetical protein [Patescibacteria group bacterium]MBU1613213.1 hypothetical protein [Patescibacteria group bacterium]
MLVIPLYFILLAYLLFLAVFAILMFVNFGHITRTGSITFVSVAFSFFICALIVLVFLGTWFFLQGIDWSTPISILDIGWIQNLFGGQPSY